MVSPFFLEDPISGVVINVSKMFQINSSHSINTNNIYVIISVAININIIFTYYLASNERGKFVMKFYFHKT